MKKLFCILAFVILGSCFANNTEYYVYPNGTFIYKSINYGPYHISTFQFDFCEIYKHSTNNPQYGKIQKLHEWTRAYTLTINDNVEASHYSYFLSLGSLFDSCKYFDVFDNTNTFIGNIEGNFSTETSAEFLFYNSQHELFAKANINDSNPKLTIMSPDGQLLITGIKVFRNFGPFSIFTDYYWKITMHDNTSLDPRFLWPFIGFLSEVWWY